MWTDIRIAVRTLGRAPLFAAVAILSLAMGIGANTAIFSLIDQVLVRNLRVADPAGLVVFHVSDEFPGHSHSDSNESVFSYPLYKDLRDRAQAFDGVIARSGAPVSVSDGGATERAHAELVSGNTFEVLGVEPALGRAIAPSDDLAPDASPVVMLAHGYWTRRFGASPCHRRPPDPGERPPDGGGRCRAGHVPRAHRRQPHRPLRPHLDEAGDHADLVRPRRPAHVLAERVRAR